jgi:ABC-type sugar transport system substrate-binding protein
MAERLAVGMMPKSTGNPYFESCRRGAAEAARELDVELLWEGPAENDPQRQEQILAGWISRRLPVVAVSVADRERLSGALSRARAQGVKVVTWDADADAPARDFMVQPATPEGLAHAVAFELGRLVAGRSQFAVITASSTSDNQNAWLRELRSRLARDRPELRLVDVRACQDTQERAREQAAQLLSAHPQLAALVGLCAPAVPGAAEAVKAAGRAGVRVTGLSLASLCRPYLQAGLVQSIVSWSTRDLGYLALRTAHGLATGILKPGALSFDAGRLRTVMVSGSEVRLGRPHIISLANLDGFDV